MNITSVSVMLSIREELVKYDLFLINILNHGLTALHFHPIQIGKELSEIRSKSLRGMHGLSFATLIQTCMLLKLASKTIQ